MSSKVHKMHYRRFALLLIMTVLLGNTSGHLALGQEPGSLRGTVVNRAGEHVKGAEIELYSGNDLTKYSASSSANGRFLIVAIRPGQYRLEIKAPGVPVRLLDVKIVAGSEKDLGTVAVGPIDCGQRGVNCDDFGYMAASFELPCTRGLELLRDAAGSVIGLESDELQRRAIRPVPINWPKSARSKYSVVVHVIIGVDGKVLCATVGGKPTEIEDAAVAALLKWQFQPVLKNGAPIAVAGHLAFQVP